jgi:hypothetical protein
MACHTRRCCACLFTTLHIASSADASTVWLSTSPSSGWLSGHMDGVTACRAGAFWSFLGAGGGTSTSSPCESAKATRMATPRHHWSCHRWSASLVHLRTSTGHTRTRRILTANAWLTIRRFPIVHHLRSLTGGTVKRRYDQHRRSCPGRDVHDPASPLVGIDQGGLRKSTNLEHYPTNNDSSSVLSSGHCCLSRRERMQ